jgi:hypothetical protein
LSCHLHPFSKTSFDLWSFKLIFQTLLEWCYGQKWRPWKITFWNVELSFSHRAAPEWDLSAQEEKEYISKILFGLCSEQKWKITQVNYSKIWKVVIIFVHCIPPYYLCLLMKSKFIFQILFNLNVGWIDGRTDETPKGVRFGRLMATNYYFWEDTYLSGGICCCCHCFSGIWIKEMYI